MHMRETQQQQQQQLPQQQPRQQQQQQPVNHLLIANGLIGQYYKTVQKVVEEVPKLSYEQNESELNMEGKDV